MNRTRVIFFVIIGLAVLIVAGGVIWSQLSNGNDPGIIEPEAEEGDLEVYVVSALPVAEWVQEAARQFNAESHTLDGRGIPVTVAPMDGYTARGR